MQSSTTRDFWQVLIVIAMGQVVVAWAIYQLGQQSGWAGKSLVPVAVAIGLVLALTAVHVLRLQRSVHYAERAIDSTNEGFWVLDSEGAFINVNPGYCRLVGLTNEEVMSRTIADFEEFADMTAIRGQIHRILESGHEKFETRHRHRDGHWVDLEITVTAIDAKYLVAFLRDVTARKQNERTLMRATAAAEAANRAKSAFLANMSHEIRTPMNGVLGLTELVLGTPLNPVQREHLLMVKRSGESLLVLLNDILDLSKIEAGELNIENVPFEPSSVVSDCVRSVATLAHNKGLEIHTDIESSLSERYLGDPVRFRQILSNLLHNAIKFTHEGAVTVRMSRQVEEGTASLWVSVSDTGIGIPADKLESVFHAFQQADGSITREYGGTGLGLAICARLAGLMEGRIWVESELGQGSCFHFTVAFEALGPAEGVAPGRALDEVDGPSVHERSLQVLLVEDHPINQRLVMHYLARLGHEVTLATNGVEALEACEDRLWDVILMDVQMPVMGGIEATRHLRMSNGGGAGTPVIALTASAMPSDRDACFDAGMDGFLTKPFQLEALREAIDKTQRGTAREEISCDVS